MLWVGVLVSNCMRCGSLRGERKRREEKEGKRDETGKRREGREKVGSMLPRGCHINI